MYIQKSKKTSFLKFSLMFKVFILGIVISAMGQTSTYLQDFNRATLAIYKVEKGQVTPHGTGFLIYNYKQDGNSLIVTCAHLLRNDHVLVNIPISDKFLSILKDKKNLDTVMRAIEATYKGEWVFTGQNFLQKVPLIKNKTYFSNDSLDIAILKYPLIKGSFIWGEDTIPINNMINIGTTSVRTINNVMPGTNIYFVGFPFGIGTYSGYANTGCFQIKLLIP